ncbi:hypothetical protein ACQKEK_09215 [Pseudomonas sp. NPDC077408]
MSERENAWEQQPLSDIFRIGREHVFPSQQPKATFVHYSIPAWDEFGGPAFDLGETIESNKTAISGPSVLVSKLNPRKPRVAVIEAPETRTCCSTEFICYQPRRAGENLRFWGMYLYSQEFSARLARAAIGSTNSHTRASPRETLGWLVPSVPLAEQEVIAQTLDTLDTAIHETEALINKLKAIKQGLLHDLLIRGIDANGQLRPPQSEAPQLYKESRLGWIPREWDVLTLGAVLSELGQGWSPDCPAEPAGVGEWGVLKTTSVVWGGYNEDENKQLPTPFKPRPDLEVKSDDILITRAGPKNRVGVVVHVPSTRSQLMISDKIYRLRLLDSEVPAYFALALSAEYMQSAISRTVSGMAESQTNISQGVIRGLAILRPMREEQHAIVEHTRAFDERLRAEELSLSKFREQKNGLMDDLLTGRVRVTPLLESMLQTTAPTGA